MYTWGKKPQRIKQVDKNYDIKKGSIYGVKYAHYLPLYAVPPEVVVPLKGVNVKELEEYYAKKVINKIKEKGDVPVYVEVVADWQWGLLGYKITITFFARKMSDGSSIATYIALIVLGMFAAGYLISVVYYVVEGEPVKVPSPVPTKEIGGVLLLIIIILILREIGKRR